MTDKELKRLRYLPRDLEILKNDLAAARERYEGCCTHDVVYGSRLIEPYNKRPLTIRVPGGSKEATSALTALQKARTAVRDCEQEIERLNAFIDNIQDPQVRRIFQLYYRDGKTWQAVSMHFGRTSEFWSRNLAKKYFQDIENIDLDDVKFKIENV